MPIMTWDAALDVGVPLMNKEHQAILDAMNAIYDAWKAGKSGSQVNDLVGRLGDITTRHFADEEAFMASVGFPTLDRHKLLHAQLLGQFATHAKAIRAAGGVANEPFFHFLKFWLTSHIKGIDAKYGEHARSRPAA